MHKNKLLLFAFVAIFTLMISFIFDTKAEAKYMGHYETPTELRGDWYMGGEGLIIHLKINKHSVYMDNHKYYSLHDHSNGNSSLLYIKKCTKNAKNGYGGTNYVFNDKKKYGDVTCYWLSHKKVHGKRVLETYTNTGGFGVYTRQKLNHNYSFTEMNNTMNMIGR